MAIFKRGNTYWYKFQFNGKRIQKSAQTANADAARTIESAERVRLALGDAGIEQPEPIPTLEEFAPRFTEQIKMDCATKVATIDFYMKKLKILLDGKLAKKRLDLIDVNAIDTYKRTRSRTASRRKTKVSAASINRELATLRRLLRMAQDWKIIKSVPKIRLLRGEVTREFVLSRELESKYIDALPASMRGLAVFLLDTGLRVGEAIKLEWQSVNLRDGFVRVRAVDAKNSKTRAVPLTPRVREVLEGQPGRQGLVFRNSDDQPLYHTWLDQQHAATRAALGLPADFVLHSLRHTFGTRLGETGADAFTIMKLMGHSTVTVSQKYVHPASESLKLAIERLSASAKPLATKVATSLKVVKA